MAKESIVGPGGGDVIRLGPATVRIIEEGFYVVSGTARFTIGAETYDAPAGTLAMIPPGAPHTFANPGDEPLVMVNTFTPDLYVQYFRDLRQMVAAGEAPTPEATAQVMSRYATELADDYAAE
jgi:oxalate decarboxylase/phosphoglucose isomerase-like protein (cupin superfamily)